MKFNRFHALVAGLLTAWIGGVIAQTSTGITGSGPTGGGSLAPSSFANPTAQVGLTAVNGSSTKAMRADAAPALNQTINPVWAGAHRFNSGVGINTAPGGAGTISLANGANTGFVQADGTGLSLGTSSNSPVSFYQTNTIECRILTNTSGMDCLDGLSVNSVPVCQQDGTNCPASGGVTETTGTFTATFTTGFTTQPTQNFSWTKVGSVVNLRATSTVTGTSNATSFITAAGDLPAAIRPSATQTVSVTLGGTNNSTATNACLLLHADGSIEYAFGGNNNGNCGAWTASGTKAVTVSSTRLSTVTYSIF